MAQPSRTGLEQPICWTVDINAGVVVLAKAPADLFPDFPLVDFAVDVTAEDEQCAYACLMGSKSTHSILLSSGTVSGMPLAAIIPLGADTLERVRALTRFWQACRGQRSTVDVRVNPQRRRRIRTMLQAVDGDLQGASYRDIAIVFYGQVRIEREHWKTSPLRDTVVRYVRGGRALIDGGYLDLLRHSRSDPKKT